ncbi:MAG TPA: DUF3465 domain-containing protein [Candidatus Aquilonibacter sp.]|nr:DUF3465 domain-containing protein [Candidatus Aquilonibacter sp.]
MTDLTGTVASEPTYFFGTRTRCEHEQFALNTQRGKVEVIDNVDIAPRVPVHTGDRIEVRGDLVHDAGRGPIIHWTHHDPDHRHPDGFIRFDGRVYA